VILADTKQEDMLNIGLTKLKLDDAVGGEEVTLDAGEGAAGPGKDDKTAKEVRKSLLTTLRHKFEAGGEEGTKIESIAEDLGEGAIDGQPRKAPVKKTARGGAASQMPA
jgi:SWI/SNF-related matrix-associated actin-dependent regulator 1 of chromatin subfamily A